MRRMDLRKVAQAGERRRKALERADLELEAIVDELEATDGERRNIAAAANVSGIARTTLYRALKARQQDTAAK